MKTAWHAQQTLPMTANPRFLERLIAVCSVMMLLILASAIWLKVQETSGSAYSGKPIVVEIRTPDHRLVPDAPSS